MNKVSIIIPIYNAEKTISRCLNAIIAQTYKNIEVICVNDGSLDKTLMILEEYAQKDDRIKVYTQENKGPAYTRHFAISQSTGEYLMFCDADDWYENNMVEHMVNTIERENTDIVMCNCNITDLTNSSIQDKNMQSYFYISIIGKAPLDIENIKKINIVLWNKIIKRSLIEQYNITYPQKYEHDDTIFMLKYFAHAKTYFGLNKCLYNYVVGNKNSLMGKLHTNRNKGKEYDFIYAYIDLFYYLRDYKYTNYIIYIKEYFIDSYFWFLQYLPIDKQENAFKHLKRFVNCSKFFKNVS